MTLRDFFHELQRLPFDRYRFYVSETGRIRARSTDGRSFSPITAMSAHLVGTRCAPEAHYAAALAIGLSLPNADTIRDACEHVDSSYPQIREEILKTLGITTKTDP